MDYPPICGGVVGCCCCCFCFCLYFVTRPFFRKKRKNRASWCCESESLQLKVSMLCKFKPLYIILLRQGFPFSVTLQVLVAHEKKNRVVKSLKHLSQPKPRRFWAGLIQKWRTTTKGGGPFSETLKIGISVVFYTPIWKISIPNPEFRGNVENSNQLSKHHGKKVLKTKNKKNACLIDMTKHTKNCDASAVLSEIIFPENLEGFSPSRQIHLFDLAKDAACRRRKTPFFPRSFPIFLCNLPPTLKVLPSTPRQRRCGKKTQGFFFAQNQLLKRNDSAQLLRNLWKSSPS